MIVKCVEKHYSSTPAEPFHEDSPKGKKCWCSFQQNPSIGRWSNISSHKIPIFLGSSKCHASTG